MEVGVKNALIHHAENFSAMGSFPDDKFGAYAPCVKMLIELAKAIGNGIRNDVDPDVLANSIDKLLFVNDSVPGMSELSSLLNKISEYVTDNGIVYDNLLSRIESQAEQIGKLANTIELLILEVTKTKPV